VKGVRLRVSVKGVRLRVRVKGVRLRVRVKGVRLRVEGERCKGPGRVQGCFVACFRARMVCYIFSPHSVREWRQGTGALLQLILALAKECEEQVCVWRGGVGFRVSGEGEGVSGGV